MFRTLLFDGGMAAAEYKKYKKEVGLRFLNFYKLIKLRILRPRLHLHYQNVPFLKKNLFKN